MNEHLKKDFFGLIKKNGAIWVAQLSPQFLGCAWAT